MEMNYASKGVANAGLATGIIGTSLGALNELGGMGALTGVIGPRGTCRNKKISPQLTRIFRQLRALLFQGRISSSHPEGSSKRNKPVRSWARTQKSERFSSFAVSRRDLPSK